MAGVAAEGDATVFVYDNYPGGIGFTGSNIDEKDVERMVKATVDKWGRIDAVVNNTGRHASIFQSIRVGMCSRRTGGMHIDVTSVLR